MRIFLSLFLALSFISPLYAAGNPCRMADGYLDRGIGGTGWQPGDKGTGGTGLQADKSKGTGGTGLRADRGIGGTGLEAEAEPIYISGTIYAFGSICVNGLRIAYDGNTPVSEGDDESSSKNLKLGQVVHVLAERIPGSASLQAKTITIDFAVEGRVHSIDRAHRILNVMGERVLLQNRAAINVLRVGDAVRVSGLRDPAGVIMASHIAARPVASPDRVVGPLHMNAAGVTMIGRTPVDLAGNHVPMDHEPVLARGVWNGQKLVIDDVRPAPSRPPREAALVSVEGYVERGHTGDVRINGVPVAHEDGGSWRDGGHVFATGRVDQEGHLTIQEHSERERPQTHIDEHGLEQEHEDDNHSSSSQESSGSSSSASGGSGSNSGSGNSGSGDQVDRPSTPEKTDKVEQPEKIEQPDKVEKADQPEKVEKIEKVEQPDKVEKVEKVEKIEKVEKVDKVEKIDKIEKPQVEKPEIEKPESKN